KFELQGKGVLSVGRAVTNDCAVVDPTVSRKHAELKLTENGLQVTDAGSSNGTFVNGVRIDGAYVAPPGAEITFGKVVFRLEQMDTPKATPAVTPAATKPAGATIVRQIPKTGEFSASGVSLSEQLSGEVDPAAKDRRKLAILLEVAKGLTKATDVH